MSDQPQWADSHNGRVLREWIGLAESGSAAQYEYQPKHDPLADLEERWYQLCRGNRASLEQYNDDRGWRLWSQNVHPRGSLAEHERLAERRWSEAEQRVRIIAAYFKPLYRCEKGGIADVWRDLPREWLWERIFCKTKWQRRLTETSAAFFGGIVDMAYSLIPASAMTSVTQLAELSKTARTEIGLAKAAGDPVIEGLLVAEAMSQMRQLITSDMMKSVMALQGSPLGFETDDKGPYPIDVVKDVFIQAQLCGARPVGNEFGIMSRKFYPKAGFFRRQIEETEGITNLLVEPGNITRASEEYSQVEMFVSWRKDGKLQRYSAIKTTDDGHDKDLRLRVRTNKGMGADAVIGKAERKVLARVHRIVTGNFFVPVDDDDDIIDGEVIDDQPTPEAATEGGSAPSGDEAALIEFNEAMDAAYGDAKTIDEIDEAYKAMYKHADTKEKRNANVKRCLNAKVRLQSTTEQIRQKGLGE